MLKHLVELLKISALCAVGAGVVFLGFHQLTKQRPIHPVAINEQDAKLLVKDLQGINAFNEPRANLDPRYIENVELRKQEEQQKRAQVIARDKRIIDRLVTKLKKRGDSQPVAEVELAAKNGIKEGEQHLAEDLGVAAQKEKAALDEQVGAVKEEFYQENESNSKVIEDVNEVFEDLPTE